MLSFTHDFDEDPKWGDLSVDLDDPSPNARIAFSAGEDGIWVTANAQGFLHLARIFAELGTRELEDGYHFHMDARFLGHADDETKPLVSVQRCTTESFDAWAASSRGPGQVR